jgi:hypothetical protein
MHAMGGSSAELRLPTVAVAVDLARVGRAIERVELFVTDEPRRGRALAAAVAALLEHDGRFVPVRDPATARIVLVARRAIVWVSLPIGDELDDELYDHEHRVQVDLDGGDGLLGRVFYSSPADRPRLVDHLNHGAPFLRLWTGDAVHLINKDHVVRVVELA